jgi:biopolymer transport protein ExbD
MRGAAVIEGIGLGAMATALAAAGLALVLLPQRLAQRPAAQGVVALAVDGQGGLRVWNQSIRPQELPALLEQARRRQGGREGTVRLRLVPDREVPWGTVQGLIGRLEGSGLPLELQLP